MSYRLIVGLGNPGSEYKQTRHNIGFQVLDNFASKQGASAWSKNRNLKGDLSVFVPELDAKIYLLKPLTFMNESGVSIQKVCSYYRIPPEEVVVVYDEINLGLGEVKVSTSGGPGGHNGLSDIASRIKPTFTRFRIGIGQKTPKEMSLADYVLGKFSKEDEILISAFMERYLDCLERLIREGADKAMIHINRKPKTKDREDGQL